jgi:hypothetical protein
MTHHETAERRPNFEALRRAIELRDQETLLGFYAEDARVRVVSADAPHSPSFEFWGRSQIAGYLRAVSDWVTTRRVGKGTSSKERIAFCETCEYPDGTWVMVRTTLEINSKGEIVEQEDVVVREREKEPGKGVGG